MTQPHLVDDDYHELWKLTRFEGQSLHFMSHKIHRPFDWPNPKWIRINGDLFDEGIYESNIDATFGVMAACNFLRESGEYKHTFQVATQNPVRMRDYLAQDRRDHWARLAFHHLRQSQSQEEAGRISAAIESTLEPLPNVWLGLSIQRGEDVARSLPILLQTPAALRWLAFDPLREPLSAPMDFSALFGRPEPGIHWILCAGARGAAAEPLDPMAVEQLVDVSCRANIPFFFREWGEWQGDILGAAAPGNSEERRHWPAGERRAKSYTSWRVDPGHFGARLGEGQHYRQFPRADGWRP